MHLLEPLLNILPADFLGWATLSIIFVTLALGLLLTRATARRSRIEKPAKAGVRRAEPRRETPKLADTAPLRNVTSPPDLQAMQARAAQQIDAAEHALNRLLAEYALVATSPAEPTFKSARQLERTPDAPAQQPIAA